MVNLKWHEGICLEFHVTFLHAINDALSLLSELQSIMRFPGFLTIKQYRTETSLRIIKPTAEYLIIIGRVEEKYHRVFAGR